MKNPKMKRLLSHFLLLPDNAANQLIRLSKRPVKSAVLSLAFLLWLALAYAHRDTVRHLAAGLFSALLAPQAVIVLLLPAFFLLYPHLAKQSRAVQVGVAFIGSLCLLEWLMWALPPLITHWQLNEYPNTQHFWNTGIILLASAPVAFTLWRFRDGNQSKDINLKEFQKISEWVMGIHFSDHTQTRHAETLSGSLKNHAAQSNDKFAAPSNTSSYTFSKQDGATGLQIAAIYNLLPFYRGDYGRDFEKPALHLLLCAWEMLQHDALQAFRQSNDTDIRRNLITVLQQRANSPLGQAITRVLLACGYNKKPLLHRHPEVLQGICLSGMNLGLKGIETEILAKTLFCGQDWSNAQLQGMQCLDEEIRFDFSNVKLNGADLSYASRDFFTRADFVQSELNDAKLTCTTIHRADFSHSLLFKTDFSYSEIRNTCFADAHLSFAIFLNAHFFQTDFSRANVGLVDFAKSTFNYGNFANADLRETNFKNLNLILSNFMFVRYLSAEQLLESESCKACLIDAKTFDRFSPKEQGQLRQHGMISIYLGSQPITQKLICNSQVHQACLSYPAAEVPYSIDLDKTRAANPDWDISIL